MSRSYLVAITIVAMEGTAIPITDPALASSFGPQIEGAAGTGQHAPHMRAHSRSLRHYRSHQVARLVAEMPLVPLPVAGREPMRIDAAHLPVAMTGGFDQQWRDLARLQLLRGALADTHRIEPMRFRQSAALPLVFGQSATAGLQGQPARFEPLKELPARRIDGGRSFQRRFRLGQDARQHVRLLVQELLDESRALLDVTRLAGQGQVAHAMRAAACAAEDMFNLQGNIFRPAVGALPPTLLKQVFPHLVAHKFPLLVVG
jgi:hypothetical protein